MLAAITTDPMLSRFIILSLIIILVGFLLRLLRQPSVITYIVVGVIVGPFGLGVISDEDLVSNLGSLGLVLLLFFIGMEIQLKDLIANWKVSVIGTIIQITVSVFVVWILGSYFKWNVNQVMMLGFVISLSSTAVVIKLLNDKNEHHTTTGKIVLGILLVQDVLIVPMLIILGYLGGNHPGKNEHIKQIIGAFLIFILILFILWKKEINLPFRNIISQDHETQVFVAFALCFGFATLTALLGLSSAIGAFVAGIVISSAKSTEWVHDSLHSFKTMFVALFFVSIGMLINTEFLKENALTVAGLVLAVFLINNTINVLVVQIFCKDWKVSVYSGALLSQIGEFSFIIGAAGYSSGIINDYEYQLVISSIALTLLLSPLWISLVRKLIRI